MPAAQKQLIHASQIAPHKMISAPESPLSLCYVTDREGRGEWDCTCAQNLNTCCFVQCGKLTNACVFKAVMIETGPIIMIHPVLIAIQILWAKYTLSILPAYTTHEDGTGRCSKMSAHKIQMPGNHQKDRIQHAEYGESWKS